MAFVFNKFFVYRLSPCTFVNNKGKTKQGERTMSINPFEQNPTVKVDDYYSLKQLCPKPYNKYEVDPYTRTRVILACGAEYEAVWFGHQMHRSCPNNDMRRQLALIRRKEQQQQKRIACLKPIAESILEHTIGYEQLAVDLTAIFAQRESDKYVKMGMDFALLEDFDHLYRYADLLEMERGVDVEAMVGGYTELMPGRPTIAEHRYPTDDVKRYVNSVKANALTKLDLQILTAAEQQTMNYYMSVANLAPNNMQRQIYGEIAMIEEQHVTLYGGMMDTTCTWCEKLLMHEYTECYLYQSLYQDETNPQIKKIWLQHYEDELGHLHLAVEMLQKYENKHWKQVIPNGEFAQLLAFGGNVNYVRQVLQDTILLTGKGEEYVCVDEMGKDSTFGIYQQQVVPSCKDEPAHNVIAKHIADFGTDYRYQTKQHPVEQLQDRKHDNCDICRPC